MSSFLSKRSSKGNRFKLFRFKKFRTRIIAFVLLLSVPIQLALFVTIRDANTTTARANIDDALQVTSEIFFNTLSQRRNSLLEKVRALSSDYAFKPAAHTNEHQTVLSSLLSYQHRAGADIMLLLTMEGEIIADTKHPELKAEMFYLPELIDRAMNSDYGEADIIGFIDTKPYLLVAVPLFSPEASHWIVMGFMITHDFALRLQQLTKSHVSLLYKARNAGQQSTKSESINQWTLLATTQPSAVQQHIEAELGRQRVAFTQNIDLSLNGESYVSVALAIHENQEGVFVALLQRSLKQALTPYQYLHFLVACTFVVAVTLLVLGGTFIARKITKPVTVLAEGANKIECGQYELQIEVDQQDELGELAGRFNSMAKGLAERAKVRSLLGKVVSSAIAEQLISKGVELGGEERQATILFCDIRNFTRLCEQHSARQIITMLNQLLTRLSQVVDNHQGVIDKYIGDAVMAIFGVPVNDEAQEQNAVLAALAMQKELLMINRELAKKQLPEIGLGVGINSATVVAGNMGSETRLNYTVIGDGVNLSSRLESLTKYYRLPVLVSENTMKQCADIFFQEIDTVRVKGKAQGLTIYQPLGIRASVSDEAQQRAAMFHRALGLYKKQQWQAALALFTQLTIEFPSVYCYQIYQQRVTERLSLDYDNEWDGVFTHLDK